MNKHYEVIIIGAGPSGLGAALYLLKNGIKDILVIEQKKFPRYKCCAGYITNKTKKEYESLGLNINKCHYCLIKDFSIFYKYQERQKIVNKFLFTNKNIDRVELDNEFFKLAKKKGLEIKENTHIINHNMSKNTIKTNNKEIFAYDYLVFADGTSGYGSKYQKIKRRNIAMQLIKKTNRKDSIEIHFGITPHGYGWVSTYKGLTNIGLTDVYNSKLNYNKIFKDYLKSLNIDENIKELRGTFTPIGTRKPIINNNIYYVGDAVGACDPLTLSGLKYSLMTAKACAKAISKRNNNIYKQSLLKLKIKFLFMQILLKIFYCKFILFLIFKIGCKFFHRLIAFAFNHFFINKK